MYVVTGEEMHRIDRYTMEKIGLSEETLMENAGQAFCRQLFPTVGLEDRLVVLIGTGNNGGDGFVIGRILKEAGFLVDVIVIPREEKIRGTALKHKRIFENSGHEWITFREVQEHFEQLLTKYTIIIDAMLGTGMVGTPRWPYSDVIESVNGATGRVIAVDIPSGVTATEEKHEVGINADQTYTFQAAKISNFLYPAAFCFGEVHILDIGIPRIALENTFETRKLITDEKVKNSLAVRKQNAHKGVSGKALIIGGSIPMTGAIVLTTGACLRTGAGLVTVAVPDKILLGIAQKTTEAMFYPLPQKNGEIEIIPSHFPQDKTLSAYDGIAVGPGLGRNNKHNLYDTFNDFKGNLVIDADGLYHLVDELDKWRGGREGGPTIITPHLGEMARLTGKTVEEVELQRFRISKQFAMEYKVYLVLKGPFTIITAPDGRQWVNQTGNESLAKGGTGDTLTGMILGFLLQHEYITDAICNAVYIHGKTADELVKSQDILSVTASDIIEVLPKVLHSSRYQT
ncbi:MULTISPECIES: NAD(P)H-hydrate dehydratase [Bacillaceae]|uniref:Bifunctional NAD(P)H-hydrate repair enzyme n=1 Tax=Evansella alkalicola TaxID=745819 RepID=A0ABS6K0E1_9BACI|nr:MULTISPECIES: NAD(P)H-hydrate dehydratase [Bacillaceae]MBU9723796.1 NAD(P)H-hydrate dehydratase [Bacillus alkalicola]